MFRYIKDLILDCLDNLRNVSGTRPLLEKVLETAEEGLDETRQRLEDLRAAVTVAMPTLSVRSSLDIVAAP